MSLSPSPSPSDAILFHHHSEVHEAAGPSSTRGAVVGLPTIPAATPIQQQATGGVGHHQIPIIPNVLSTSTERIPTPQQQGLSTTRPHPPPTSATTPGTALLTTTTTTTPQTSLMSTAAQMAAFMNERTRYLATLQHKLQRPSTKTENHQSIRPEHHHNQQQQQQTLVLPQQQQQSSSVTTTTALDFPMFNDPANLAAKLFKDDGSFRRLHMGSRRRDSRCSLHRLLGRACKGRGTQVVTECEFKANYGVWTLAGLDRIKSLRSKGYTSAQIYSAVEAAAGIALPMLERLQYLEDAPGSRIAKALTLPGKAASGNAAVKHHRGPTRGELMAIWSMLEIRHLNDRKIKEESIRLSQIKEVAIVEDSPSCSSSVIS